MKKSFLLLAVCAMSMTGMAQTKVAANLAVSKQKHATVMTASEMKKAPRRDFAGGVYYNRQGGTFYNGLDPQARGYRFARLFAPAFSTIKFTNMCNQTAAAVWGFGGQQYTDIADENNDLLLELGQAGSGYRMPEIYVGSDVYSIGSTLEGAAYNGVYGDTIDHHSFVDQQSSSMYAFGSLDTHYTFGTGSITPTQGDAAGRTFRSHGLVMTCPDPIAPLYVEQFNFLVYNNMVSQPIAEGKEVVMQIRNVEIDEEGNRSIGSNILYELTATSSDVSDAISTFATEYSSSGQASVYNVTFSNKTVDPFGTVVDDPIIIDQPFYIVILGHEQEGINFGYRLAVQPDEDNIVYGTFALCYEDSDTEMTDGYNMWYGRECVVDMSFYGGYDYIDCLADAVATDNTELHGINVLRVSADGNDVTNEGSEEALQGNVVFNSAFAWEVNGDTNYEAQDLPSWIELVPNQQIEAGQYSDGTPYEYYTGTTYMTVECEALPAGQTKRAASIYFEGHGAKSATPMIVLQGDATVADAIENVVVVKANQTAAYNIAGQKVNDNFKGIVIKNGKKSIQK